MGTAVERSGPARAAFVAAWLCDLMAARLICAARADMAAAARMQVALLRWPPDYAFSPAWTAVIEECRAWLADWRDGSRQLLPISPAFRAALDEPLPAEYAWQRRRDVA